MALREDGMTHTIAMVLLVAALTGSACAADQASQVGNLGYNSYEGYLSKGQGLEKFWGPGVGYPTDAGGDFFRRYYEPKDWGRFGYGTGHLGEGYGPLIYGRRSGETPPGMFDPLPAPYRDSPPPRIKISSGRIRVSLPDLPGVRCVTVTVVAYNNADLAIQTLQCPPFAFDLPVLDGVKNVRVRIDYANKGLSATSYPLG